MQHKYELERIKSVIEETKNDLAKELESLPEGMLEMRMVGGKRFYYQCLPKTGNRKKARNKGITNDIEMIMSLVRKRYVQKALKVIDKDIKALDMAIKHYIPFDAETLMHDYLIKYPELEAGIYHGMQSDEEWAEDFIRQKDFYTEDLNNVSFKGESMRSRGELYIASRLDHHGIPYRYEASIPHPDVSRIPDFTIRRPRDGKIIYWEHLGLTDDRDYMEGNELKFIEYENVDIVPWDNLIITYDMKGGGFDAKIIEAMIEGWLL